MRPNRPFIRPARRAALALTLGLALLLPLAQAPAQTSAQAPSPAPSAAGVQVGLEGARLVDFIRFLGQFLGGAPVLREDQVPPVSVSVVAPEPMAEGELRELLELVLRPAGLEAVRRGGVSYVLPMPSIGAPRHLLPPDAQILAWRLPAQTSPGRAQAVAGVLEGLRSDRGRALSSGRLIVLADEAPRVARLRPVLQALSALPPDHAPEIVPLVRAQARQAARALEMQMRGAALSVLPLEWSNSLLLAGTPEALGRARTLLAQADGAGPEAPVLKAYRTRHVRPDKVLEALREKLGAGTDASRGDAPRVDTPRLSLDQDGQAVLALASPEALARLDRLVEDLDQPRPRVYIEALVAEFTPEALAQLALTGEQPADRNGPGGADGFRVGSALVLRGHAADAAQLGMEGLAALWSREPGVRVLSVPRLAVLEGAEARVSGGLSATGAASGADASGQAEAERFRLTLSPRLEPGQAGVAGRVLLRVGLVEGPAGGQTNGQDAGRNRNLEAALSEGQVLLVGSPAREAGAKAGWSVFSAPRRDEGPGRLVVVASARVVRPAAPDRGVGPAGAPGSAGPQGRGVGESGGRGARDKN